MGTKASHMTRTRGTRECLCCTITHTSHRAAAGPPEPGPGPSTCRRLPPTTQSTPTTRLYHDHHYHDNNPTTARPPPSVGFPPPYGMPAPCRSLWAALSAQNDSDEPESIGALETRPARSCAHRCPTAGPCRSGSTGYCPTTASPDESIRTWPTTTTPSTPDPPAASPDGHQNPHTSARGKHEW